MNTLVPPVLSDREGMQEGFDKLSAGRTKPDKPPSKHELAKIRAEGERGAAVVRHQLRVMLKMSIRDMTLDELITVWWEAQAER